MALHSRTGKMGEVSKILGSAWAGKMGYKTLSKNGTHSKLVPVGRACYY